MAFAVSILPSVCAENSLPFAVRPRESSLATMDTECQICMDSPASLQACVAGHRFCGPCLSKWSRTREHAGNVAWLAGPALGESWHNYHHADPTAARHGVLWRQVDPSAATIRFMERRGWVSRVRWPSEDRVRSKLVDPDQPVRINGALVTVEEEKSKESSRPQ